MTKDEYLKLVKGSVSFKGMSKKMQEKILVATGAEMLNYAKIFNDEKNTLLTAKKELMQKNDQAVSQLKVEIKTIKRKELQNNEARLAQAEATDQQILLNKLNNL